MNQEGLVQFVEEESGSGGKNLTSCGFTVYCICQPQQTPLLSPKTETHSLIT